MSKTVLITGASKGIGRELTILFAREGYDLVLVARSKELLVDLGKKLTKKYMTNITILEKDLTVKDAPVEIYNEIKDRKIDILVNNAGFGDYMEFLHSDWDKQAAMIQLNVTALMHMTKLLLPDMHRRKEGRILNLASTASFLPGPNMSVYYATKAAVLSFSQALSKELESSGITVTALCPGPTATSFEDAAGLMNSRLFHSLKVAGAREVAAYGYKALMMGKPVAVQGIGNKLLVLGIKISPRGLALNMINQIQSKLRSGKPAKEQIK